MDYPSGFPPIDASRIITDDRMVKQVPHPRSLGRSRRRARLGHRQHYVTAPSRDVVRLPDGTMIMHSATWSLLKATLEASGAPVAPSHHGDAPC